MTTQNNNKKWIVGGSITLLLIFGTAMGAGALIGTYKKPADDYLRIYAGDQIFMEEDINLGNEDTSNEQKARMLETQFYSAALFGTVNNEDVSTPAASTYILQDGNDWNLPFISTQGTDNDTLRTEFLKVKFLSDTQDTSVASYLNTLYTGAQGESKIKIMAAIMQLQADAQTAGILLPEVTGLDLISNESFNASKEMIFDALNNDDAYLKDALKDIMTYVYLWQEPSQSAYDYIFTRELVYSSPTLVSKMVIDGEAISDSTDATVTAAYDAFKNADETTAKPTASEWNETFDAFKENDILVDNSTADDYISTGTEDGFKGYQGVQFGTSAGSNLKSDYLDWSNTWLYNDETEGYYTYNGNYTNNDVVTNGNYYLSSTSGADGEGALIYDTSIDETDPIPNGDEGSRTVYVYNQLYPYVFREQKSMDGGFYTLGNEEFSLFANGDSSAYTKAEDETTANYIFDLWFNDQATDGEIYVAEALMNHDSSLATKALNYWNDKGFYIELSGSYETDLLQYLPDGIIMTEE